MNKRALVDKILKQLLEEMASYARAARAAHAEATDPQSKAENKYDTRGLEAAYLAGAQSRQALEARTAIESFEKLKLKEFQPGAPIDLSALVELDGGGEISLFFIGPAGGGLEIRHGKREVLLLTPKAPLGAELMGRAAGDRFKWGSGHGAAEYRIVAVS